jgi:hypothetical protein
LPSEQRYCILEIVVINSKRKDINTVKTRIVNLFTRISYKLNFSNKKNNQLLLGLDLLKDKSKIDLLFIVTKNVEKTYTYLFQQPNSIALMEKDGEVIFFRLLEETCEEFLMKHYGCKIKVNSKALRTSLYTKNVLQDLGILFKLPFYALLNSKSQQFRIIYSPIYTSASESFIEALVDNLIIELGNCITYFNVITFSSLYSFRQTFYRSKFLSLRNFERYKNNLIWQLNIKNYLQRPSDIYNNRYRIYILRTTGIYDRIIYANRSNQLLALTKLPLLTVTTIELRDFLISRLDETIYRLSNGLRFTLTSVLGKVIGLIWRGIIEGLKK